MSRKHFKWALVALGALFILGAGSSLLGANDPASATAIEAPTPVTGGPAPKSDPTPEPTVEATPKPTPRPTPKPTPEPASAPTFGPGGAVDEGSVVDVVDGDTIKVSIAGTTYTVRYIGIDTPETVDPNSPVMWMGPEASAANEQLVAGQTVTLERDVSETDRFGRLLRYVWLPTPKGWLLVNEELVRLGFASSSSYPPDVHYQDRFVAAQRKASKAGRGLWGPTPAPQPTPSAGERAAACSGQLRPELPGRLHPTLPAGPRLRRDLLPPVPGRGSRPSRI